MIVSEHYATRPDGAELVRAYSDDGKYIRKVGTLELYAEAIDIAPVKYTYEETDTLIETEPEAEEETADEGEDKENTESEE